MQNRSMQKKVCPKLAKASRTVSTLLPPPPLSPSRCVAAGVFSRQALSLSLPLTQPLSDSSAPLPKVFGGERERRLVSLCQERKEGRGQKVVFLQFAGETPPEKIAPVARPERQTYYVQTNIQTAQLYLSRLLKCMFGVPGIYGYDTCQGECKHHQTGALNKHATPPSPPSILVMDTRKKRNPFGQLFLSPFHPDPPPPLLHFWKKESMLRCNSIFWVWKAVARSWDSLVLLVHAWHFQQQYLIITLYLSYLIFPMTLLPSKSLPKSYYVHKNY